MGGDDKNRMSQMHPPPLPKAQTNDEGEDREGEDRGQARDTMTKTGTNDVKCVVWAIDEFLLIFLIPANI